MLSACKAITAAGTSLDAPACVDGAASNTGCQYAARPLQHSSGGQAYRAGHVGIVAGFMSILRCVHALPGRKKRRWN